MDRSRRPAWAAAAWSRSVANDPGLSPSLSGAASRPKRSCGRAERLGRELVPARSTLPRSGEHAVFDLQYLAGIGVDEDGVVAVAHPFVAGRRDFQGEQPIVADDVGGGPVGARQDLAVRPGVRRPAAGRMVGPDVEGAGGPGNCDYKRRGRSWSVARSSPVARSRVDSRSGRGAARLGAVRPDLLAACRRRRVLGGDPAGP